mgnify:CR=1 FL=1
MSHSGEHAFGQVTILSCQQFLTHCNDSPRAGDPSVGHGECSIEPVQDPIVWIHPGQWGEWTVQLPVRVLGCQVRARCWVVGQGLVLIPGRCGRNIGAITMNDFWPCPRDGEALLLRLT